MASVPSGDKMDFGQVPAGWIFYETFSKDRNSSKLHGNIIFISIGAWEKKFYHKKLETKLIGQQKKVCKKSKEKLNFFSLKH